MLRITTGPRHSFSPLTSQVSFLCNIVYHCRGCLIVYIGPYTLVPAVFYSTMRKKTRGSLDSKKNVEIEMSLSEFQN
jgi:hypothetical protein